MKLKNVSRNIKNLLKVSERPVCPCMTIETIDTIDTSDTSDTSDTIATSATSATNSKQLKFGTLCDTMKKDTTSFNVERNNYVRFLSISEVKHK